MAGIVSDKASLQRFQRSLSAFFKDSRQLRTISSRRLGFDQLCETFIQPHRTFAIGRLPNERVSELVLQDPRQFRSDAGKSFNRDAQLAIVERGSPGGSQGDIEIGLIG